MDRVSGEVGDHGGWSGQNVLYISETVRKQTNFKRQHRGLLRETYSQMVLMFQT